MATIQTAPAGVSTQTGVRRGYSLRLVVILGYLGAVIDSAITLIASGSIIPPVLIFAVISLLAAGLATMRWRWSPILPLVLGLIVLGGSLANPFPLFALTHPASERLPFISLTIQFALLIMSVVAGATMLGQTLRQRPADPPRWLAPTLSGVLGVALGVLLLGTTASFSGAATASGASGSHTEVVHLSGVTFSPDIIALHAGDTLTVVDDSPTPHILANGAWSASNQAQPGTEQGAPVIANVELNNNTKVLGPFTTPGTYHIYCTVHSGMNLTVVVQ